MTFSYVSTYPFLSTQKKSLLKEYLPFFGIRKWKVIKIIEFGTTKSLQQIFKGGKIIHVMNNNQFPKMIIQKELGQSTNLPITNKWYLNSRLPSNSGLQSSHFVDAVISCNEVNNQIGRQSCFATQPLQNGRIY